VKALLGLVIASGAMTSALAAQDAASGSVTPREPIVANTAPRARTPAGLRDARPWSVRMVETVMTRHPVVHEKWDYTAGLVLTGVERLGDRTGNARYRKYVRDNMDRLVQPDGSIATYRAEEFNLDQVNQGRLLFPLYARTKDGRYEKAIEMLRDQLRKQPRTSEGGFWHKQIYPQQMWLDGLYMAEPFYAQYASLTHDSAAFDDIARQFLLAARHTRDAKTGLLYHAWDASRSQGWADSLTGVSKNFWGRADGWYAMALVDVLDFLPASHPDRAALVKTLGDLADAVARVQDPVTGLWWQVLDQGSRKGNYLESSASSMFVYALAKGARKGYIAPRFAAIARRGYDGIIANLVTVDSAGLVSLHNVCQVAGLGGAQNRSGTYDYYISEPVVADDYKGVGAFILASLELGR
jgi:unsaturated rhamnogalacturonyl hydrolase